MEKGKLIALDDHWVSIAIDNLESFGDVGYLDFKFLEQVLPHCSKDQLIHIEKSTKDKDLSPITDKLWKKFFEREFGVKATDEVIEKMKQKKASCKWSELYQTKLKRVEEAENKVGERLKRLYQKEEARKQSRQVRVLDKIPSTSTSNKRSCGGSKLMDKARKEYMKCREVRNIQAMKMKASLLKKPSQPRSIQVMKVF